MVENGGPVGQRRLWGSFAAQVPLAGLAGVDGSGGVEASFGVRTEITYQQGQADQVDIDPKFSADAFFPNKPHKNFGGNYRNHIITMNAENDARMLAFGELLSDV